MTRHIEIADGVIPFKFTRDTCFRLLCMIQVKAQYDYQVNVTVLDISFLRRSSSSCLLWGLVIVEYLNNNYKESLCRNHDRSIRDFSSVHFYSSNSSFILILYNFLGVSQTTASGLMSRTKCKCVHFDPCEYAIAYCYSMLKAKSYLLHITQFSNLTLLPNDFIPVSDLKKNVFFSLSNGNCVVIQIGTQLSRILTKNDFLPNCLVDFLNGCPIIFSSMNKYSHISSIQGQLLSAQYTADFRSSRIIIYIMKWNQLLASTYFKFHHPQKINPTLEHFELVSSVSVRISISGRNVDWLDIVLRSNYSYNWISSIKIIHKIHHGLNVVPRITDYGPALFSSADILLKLVNNASKYHHVGSTSHLSVDITKGFALSHKNYYIPFSKYIWIDILNIFESSLG